MCLARGVQTLLYYKNVLRSCNFGFQVLLVIIYDFQLLLAGFWSFSALLDRLNLKFLLRNFMTSYRFEQGIWVCNAHPFWNTGLHY